MGTFSTAAPQHSNEAQKVQAKKNPADSLDSHKATESDATQPQPSPPHVAQVLPESADGERQTKLNKADDEGTEFLPAIRGYRVKVSDGALVGTNVLLFLATFALWLSTRRLVKDAGKTAEQQLRAYIQVLPAGISDITPNSNVIIRIAIVNGGSAPAYKCRVRGDVIFAEHPLPNGFDFPELPPAAKSVYTIHQHTSPGSAIIARNRFTKSQIIEGLQAPGAGGKRIYVCGIINYTDIFKRDRWTKFCLSFNGFHEMIPLAQRAEWDAISANLKIPGITFQFDAALQHNDTDDD